MKGHSLGGIPCKKCGKIHNRTVAGYSRLRGHNFGDRRCLKCGQIHIHYKNIKPGQQHATTMVPAGYKNSIFSVFWKACEKEFGVWRHPRKGKQWTTIQREVHAVIWNTPEHKEKLRANSVKQRHKKHDTSIELTLQALLRKHECSFRMNVPIDAVATPDIVVDAQKIAIFADGCYWHGCEIHRKRTERGCKQRLKDEKITALLTAKGWKVLRFWEHEIEADSLSCIKKVMDIVRPVSVALS